MKFRNYLKNIIERQNQSVCTIEEQTDEIISFFNDWLNDKIKVLK